MTETFAFFERFVRQANQLTEARQSPAGGLHPFDERNIHERLRPVAKKLFDDGHYAQATFEGFKFVDKEVQRWSSLKHVGAKLMQQAFASESPLIALTPLSNESEKDEQKGYQFLFTGSVWAIRNPRGHEVGVIDSPDLCLDHLSLGSMLLRRVEDAGFK